MEGSACEDSLCRLLSHSPPAAQASAPPASEPAQLRVRSRRRQRTSRSSVPSRSPGRSSWFTRADAPGPETRDSAICAITPMQWTSSSEPSPSIVGRGQGEVKRSRWLICVALAKGISALQPHLASPANAGEGRRSELLAGCRANLSNTRRRKSRCEPTPAPKSIPHL